MQRRAEKWGSRFARWPFAFAHSGQRPEEPEWGLVGFAAKPEASLSRVPPAHPPPRSQAHHNQGLSMVQDACGGRTLLGGGELPMPGAGSSFGLTLALTEPPQFSHRDLRVPTDLLLQLLPGEQVQHRLGHHAEQPSTHGCDLEGAQEGSHVTVIGLSPGQPTRALGAGTVGPQRGFPELMDILGMGCTEEAPSWSWF